MESSRSEKHVPVNRTSHSFSERIHRKQLQRSGVSARSSTDLVDVSSTDLGPSSTSLHVSKATPVTHTRNSPTVSNKRVPSVSVPRKTQKPDAKYDLSDTDSSSSMSSIGSSLSNSSALSYGSSLSSMSKSSAASRSFRSSLSRLTFETDTDASESMDRRQRHKHSSSKSRASKSSSGTKSRKEKSHTTTNRTLPAAPSGVADCSARCGTPTVSSEDAHSCGESNSDAPAIPCVSNPRVCGPVSPIPRIAAMQTDTCCEHYHVVLFIGDSRPVSPFRVSNAFEMNGNREKYTFFCSTFSPEMLPMLRQCFAVEDAVQRALARDPKKYPLVGWIVSVGRIVSVLYATDMWERHASNMSYNVLVTQNCPYVCFLGCTLAVHFGVYLNNVCVAH